MRVARERGRGRGRRMLPLLLLAAVAGATSNRRGGRAPRTAGRAGALPCLRRRRTRVPNARGGARIDGALPRGPRRRAGRRWRRHGARRTRIRWDDRQPVEQHAERRRHARGRGVNLWHERRRRARVSRRRRRRRGRRRALPPRGLHSGAQSTEHAARGAAAAVRRSARARRPRGSDDAPPPNHSPPQRPPARVRARALVQPLGPRRGHRDGQRLAPRKFCRRGSCSSFCRCSSSSSFCRCSSSSSSSSSSCCCCLHHGRRSDHLATQLQAVGCGHGGRRRVAASRGCRCPRCCNSTASRDRVNRWHWSPRERRGGDRWRNWLAWGCGAAGRGSARRQRAHAGRGGPSWKCTAYSQSARQLRTNARTTHMQAHTSTQAARTHSTKCSQASTNTPEKPHTQGCRVHTRRHGAARWGANARRRRGAWWHCRGHTRHSTWWHGTPRQRSRSRHWAAWPYAKSTPVTHAHACTSTHKQTHGHTHARPRTQPHI